MKANVQTEVGGVPHPGVPPPRHDNFALTTPGSTHARVAITVGSQYDFGRVKVSAYVELECDQDERTIDQAGELAFGKATEMMTDAMKLLTGEEGKPAG